MRRVSHFQFKKWSLGLCSLNIWWPHSQKLQPAFIISFIQHHLHKSFFSFNEIVIPTVFISFHFLQRKTKWNGMEWNLVFRLSILFLDSQISNIPEIQKFLHSSVWNVPKRKKKRWWSFSKKQKPKSGCKLWIFLKKGGHLYLLKQYCFL